MIVENIGIVLGADLFEEGNLHAPIMSHTAPRLIESTVNTASIIFPPSTIRQGAAHHPDQQAADQPRTIYLAKCRRGR
jgi:hypothetical protein